MAMVSLPHGCVDHQGQDLRVAISKADAELKHLESAGVQLDALRRERLTVRSSITVLARQRGVDPDYPPASVGDLEGPVRQCRVIASDGSVEGMRQQLEGMNTCIQRGRAMEKMLADLDSELDALRARHAAVDALPQPRLEWGTDCSRLDEDERRLLSFVSDLAFPSSVEEVRAVVRGLGEPVDMGCGNSEAGLRVSFTDIPMSANFSFHAGQLVSHGVWTRGLHAKRAERLYRSAAECLLARLGTVPERSGPSEDAHPGFGRGYSWIVDGKLIGVSWDQIYDGSQVSWGAQAASPGDIASTQHASEPPASSDR